MSEPTVEIPAIPLEIPWYQSGIIRQQVVQVVVGIATLAGVAADVDWNAAVGAAFSLVAIGTAIMTVRSRITKPLPTVVGSKPPTGG